MVLLLSFSLLKIEHETAKAELEISILTEKLNELSENHSNTTTQLHDLQQVRYIWISMKEDIYQFMIDIEYQLDLSILSFSCILFFYRFILLWKPLIPSW